jgi:hypothetical protein
MKVLAVLSLALLGSCAALEEWATAPAGQVEETKRTYEVPIDADGDGVAEGTATFEVPPTDPAQPKTNAEAVAEGAAGVLTGFGPLGAMAGLALMGAAGSLARRKE